MEYSLSLFLREKISSFFPRIFPVGMWIIRNELIIQNVLKIFYLTSDALSVESIPYDRPYITLDGVRCSA